MSTLLERWAQHVIRQHPEMSTEAVLRVAREAAATLKEPPEIPPQSYPINPATLRKQAEETFGLTWLDRAKLYFAWNVIKRKVGHMGNWRTTLLGAIAAALNYALVMLQNGTPVPQNSRDWIMLGLSCAIAGFAFVTKDSSVGSQPGDPPTKERIAGALEHGEAIKVDDVAKSIEAAKVVDELAGGANVKPGP